MKKKSYLIGLLILGLLAIVLGFKHLLKTDQGIKPTVELTVYTLSPEDTQQWQSVQQLDTTEATYLIHVAEATSSEELFSNIIEDATAIGFGVSKQEVTAFNAQLLEEPIEDTKHNKLLGIEFLTFAGEDEGFVVADFDYGKEAFNAQKKERKKLYKELYEAFKAH